MNTARKSRGAGASSGYGLLGGILVLEAVVALLVVSVVARGHEHVAIRIALAVVLAVCLILAAGWVGRRLGRAFATVLQFAFIASGVLAWPMWILGVMFFGLWIAGARTLRARRVT